MFRALNDRGKMSEPILRAAACASIRIGRIFRVRRTELRGTLKPLPALFPEEERSKQPSAFSILRVAGG